jgi:hypothetical protein
MSVTFLVTGEDRRVDTTFAYGQRPMRIGRDLTGTRTLLHIGTSWELSVGAVGRRDPVPTYAARPQSVNGKNV